jgi:sulfoquinovosyltransferase
MVLKLFPLYSFPFPWYQKVPLSLALSPRIISEVARFKPDIIHASSPGIMVRFAFEANKSLLFIG